MFTFDSNKINSLLAEEAILMIGLFPFKMNEAGPIGVFDSGYGGLTVLKGLVKNLPKYDFLYLGDNARAPYGPRSFDRIYEFTLQGVKHLFDQGCSLVILACNTASAEALKTIQQKDLHYLGVNKKVLGAVSYTHLTLPTIYSV